MTENLVLTDEEVELVLSARATKQFYKTRAETRRTCKHDWSYRGEWRGESSYECYTCGETKWE